MDKKKLYIILIAAAAVVLTGLIILAVSIKINMSGYGTEPTTGQNETTTERNEDTTAENTTQPQDTTGEAMTDPEDVTDATGAENTTGDPTDATDETHIDSESNSGSESNTGNSNGDSSGNSGSATQTEPTLPDAYPYNVTWKEYEDMTEAEQIAFYKCFKNHNEYKAWRTAAKKEYDENKIEIEIGEDGKIDVGQVLKGQG